MLARSLSESYSGIFLSVYSILIARSFPAARSHLWIDRPHCRDLRKLLQLLSRFGHWPGIRAEVRRARGKTWPQFTLPNG